MQRFLILTAAMAVVTGGLNAATIQTQIGGANGLTSAYVGSGVGSIGASAAERGYDSRLFANAMEGSATMVPYAGYQQFTAQTGTLVDSANGVTFNMINDGCTTPGGVCNGTSTASNNFWDLGVTGGAPTTVTVPIGIFGVTDVYTMLNNVWGTPLANDTNVIFTWGNTANATSGLTTLTVNLTNAANNGATTGQIGTSVDCATVGTCANFAIDSLAPTTTISGIQVRTNTIYSSAYNSVVGGQFGNSAGVVTLDDQGFIFGGSFANTHYLVSVGIQELVGTGAVSQTALSAITVDSIATPEPSTIMLVLTGFGALGAARLRRRKQ